MLLVYCKPFQMRKVITFITRRHKNFPNIECPFLPLCLNNRICINYLWCPYLPQKAPDRNPDNNKNRERIREPHKDKHPPIQEPVMEMRNR